MRSSSNVRLTASAVILTIVAISIGTLCQTNTVQAQAPKWSNASDPNVISYTQAASYSGQYKTVEGIIVHTFFSIDGTLFLDFHNPYQGYFYGIIFSSDRANFHFTPESFYYNKDVRITGTIQMYNGAPEIVVHTPSQIEVAYMGFNYP